MQQENLYIIGNGFDIYHGIYSNYYNFKEYLSDADRYINDLIEEFIHTKEDWSDFEAALAIIDIDNVVDNSSQFLVSYGAWDWSDAYHHDYQYEVNRIIEGLSVSLKERFSEWVRRLRIPTLRDLKVHPLGLSVTSHYLNFNYTPSLTEIYSIPRNNILYIHGEAQEDEELILGHAWNPVEIPSLNDVPDPESMDTRVMEGNEIINDYFGKTFKNSGKIIFDHSAFFRGLSGMSKITVLGHSLSPVDEAYFREIVKNINTGKVQ
ncbi:MAG: bacteriophage abortive infection AbiH family protein [Desulfobulbus sp.]|nr:bacteriophage abortive infection AbiH family protein [Desulfobulbus sp.]